MNLSSDGGDQRIHVRAGNRLMTSALAAILLASWTYAGIPLVQRWFAQRAEHALGIYFLLPLWSVACAFLVLSFIWSAFGEEVLYIRGSNLTVERKVGPIMISRPKAFDVDRIQGLRIESRRIRFRGKTVERYALAFDYAGQKRDLLASISKQQAELLLNGPLLRFLRNQA